MRALWLVRSNLETNPGGDTTQILRTAAALRRRGISVVVSSDPKPSFDKVDIVHLFHLDRLWENSRWCRQIVDAGIPSVLSPIYWPSDEFDQGGRAGVQGIMSRLAGVESYQNLRIMQRSALPALATRDFTTINRHMFNFIRSAKFVLNTVDAVLPNSNAEFEALCSRFATQPKVFVIRNAVSSETYYLPPANTEREPGSVICVGRIEPRKNQLALIRALKNSDVHLLIVGQAGRFSPRYERQCRREAGPNVGFVDWRTPDELRQLYQSARVHASVSWYETPGLASLEAAACGCNPVVSTGGSTTEYFHDEVDYCAPDQPETIRDAIGRALARRSKAALSRRIVESYSWKVAAQETLNAYDYAVKSRLNPAINRGEALHRPRQSRT